MAMDFRKTFHRDVVIDLYAYRRWGHNEGDEPRFTQPTMYSEIDQRPSVRQNYLNRLLETWQDDSGRSGRDHSRANREA